MELNGFDHFIFFVICIFLPVMSLLSAKAPNIPDLEPSLPPKKHIYFSNGLLLWIGALLVLTNWNLTQKSWELMGIKMPVISSTVIILCATLILIYMADSLYTIIKGKDESKTTKIMDEILPVNWKEYGYFTFLAVSAGICEEIVFRGFLVNYFLEITSGSSASILLSIVIPAIVFSISHLYQGWFNVMKIFSLALLFCAIFLFSQSLLLVILIHVAVDLISGALVVFLARRENASINE